MPRAPFQVVVLPFRTGDNGSAHYCVLHRSDLSYWQFIAGGGEDDEAPEQAARREALEESDLPPTIPMYRLQSSDTVAVTNFKDRHY
jgi:dATP pyrophosphohydrolase